MATRDELYTALRNADAAGDAEGARKLAAYIQSMPADAAPAKPAKKVDILSREGVTTAAGGATFGFGDEFAAAYKANLETMRGWLPDALGGQDPGAPWKTRYEAHRDFLRGQEDAYKASNPLTATGLQVAASLPSMAVTAPAGAVVKGTGMLANAARAGLTGGASGTLSGAGNSRADSLAGVAEDAAIGGATGAALGSAAVPAIGVLGAAVRPVASKLNNTAAANYAREKVAEAFSRDARGSVFKRNSLLDDVPANPAGPAAAKLNKLGGEARVVDAGGQSTRSTLDLMATLPGETKDAAELAIRARQAGRGARMIGAADEALGAGGQRAKATVDALVEKRSAEAKPLYDKVHAMVVPIDEELASIIDASRKLGATGMASKMATADRQPFTLVDKGLTAASARDLDRLKQSLDDAIMGGQGTNAETGRLTGLGVSLSNLRAALIEKMDKATGGAYAEARSAYAGKSAIIDAVNKGRKALTQDDATIGGLTEGMSPSQLEGFRVGAFEALRAKLGVRSGQTSLIEMWREPAVQEKLKAIFGTERAYREFAANVAAEGRMKGLESVGRGSQTASRHFAAGDLDVEAAKDAGAGMASAAGGNLLGAIPLVTKAWNRVSTPEPVRNEMGRILLSQGPQAKQEMARLADYIDRVNAARNQNALRTGSFVGANFSSPVRNALAPQ